MRRRDVFSLLATVAAWPIVASAQQSTMPVLGFLNIESAQNYAGPLAAFLKGLAEAGFVDGRNVTIEYRWANGRSEQLPDLAVELAQKQVAVIAATSTPAAIAAKAATSTIPVVFETAADPIRLGREPIQSIALFGDSTF